MEKVLLHKFCSEVVQRALDLDWDWKFTQWAAAAAAIGTEEKITLGSSLK